MWNGDYVEGGLGGGGLLGYQFIKHGSNYGLGNGEGVERIC